MSYSALQLTSNLCELLDLCLVVPNVHYFSSEELSATNLHNEEGRGAGRNYIVLIFPPHTQVSNIPSHISLDRNAI